MTFTQSLLVTDAHLNWTASTCDGYSSILQFK